MTGVIVIILILTATYYRDNYSVRGIPFSTSSHVVGQPEAFLLLVASVFSLNTVLGFLTALCDEHTGAELHRTLYDLMFHIIGGVLFLASSIWTIAFETRFRTESLVQSELTAAGALGLLTGLAHLAHTFISYRGYRSV